MTRSSTDLLVHNSCRLEKQLEQMQFIFHIPQVILENAMMMADLMHHSFYELIMRRLPRRKQTEADQRLQREKRRRPSPVFSFLESLPMELMQMVLDRLDLVSQVCLRNTTSRFRSLIPPVEEKYLSRCQKWLIMCRFETDMKKYPNLVACAFCKVKRPQKDFGAKVKTDLPRFFRLFQTGKYCGIEYLNMMKSRPVERFCYRHLTSCLGWPPAFQNAKHIRWVHTLEPTCLHCGSKPASCGQSAAKFHKAPATRFCCNRPCDVCLIAYLSTYSRHGPIRSYWFTTEDGEFVCRLGRSIEGYLTMAEYQGKNGYSILVLDH